jgi:hypothetical protein
MLSSWSVRQLSWREQAPLLHFICDFVLGVVGIGCYHIGRLLDFGRGNFLRVICGDVGI